MTMSRLIAPVVLSAAIGGQAAASPFCVQLTGYPLQCLYVDPAQCQHEALRLGGVCAANPAEFTTPAGTSGFCTVESGNVSSCAYADRGSCMAEAHHRNAACIEAVPAKPPKATDPYQIIRPY
ncbi:MAG: hypothetical protein JO255_06070 [Alphaproteobacteria bacterium]|nr:hypothetical protein [Alphaproteobacteria bacterium]